MNGRKRMIIKALYVSHHIHADKYERWIMLSWEMWQDWRKHNSADGYERGE